jgi:lia operon protein LiaG
VKRILFLFILVLCLYLVFTKVNFGSWLPFGGSKTQEAAVTTNTTMITLNLSGVNAEIVPKDRANLQTELKGSGNVTVQQRGDNITVTYHRKWYEWFSFFNRTKLTIYIPQSYQHNMELAIGSGNLDFIGQASNPMKLDHLSVILGSGNLHLKNLVVNHLEDRCASGNNNIERIKTKDGSFEVSSGNVIVKHFQGPLKTRLSSGNFKAQLDQLKNPVDVEVSSGNVQLDLPQDADFTLNGKISSGIISSDFPLKNEKRDSHTLQGTHGSGKYDVNLSVSSGRIKVY